VLLLGETGTGKSTVTRYIAENNYNLVSQETIEDTGDFIIVDNNSDYSTITSKGSVAYVGQ
jgi:broad-specificity NMP kinase